VLGCWGAGVLRCWGAGVLGCRGAEVLRLQSPQVLAPAGPSRLLCCFTAHLSREGICNMFVAVVSPRRQIRHLQHVCGISLTSEKASATCSSATPALRCSSATPALRCSSATSTHCFADSAPFALFALLLRSPLTALLPIGSSADGTLSRCHDLGCSRVVYQLGTHFDGSTCCFLLLVMSQAGPRQSL
jgi:hypothetical protein